MSDFIYTLSPRMKAIADMVITGEVLADVGTDHGFIPIHLLAENEVPYIILTDINDGPVNTARAHLEENQFNSDFYSVRKGDGLDPIKPGEASTVIIAGMGGELIESIISKDMVKSKSFKRFVLQPRTHANEMRLFLSSNGFKYADYRLVKEKNRICEVIAVSPTDELVEPDTNLISPYLLSKNDPLIGEFIEYKIKLANTVLANLSNSDSDESAELKNIWEGILEDIQRIKKEL